MPLMQVKLCAPDEPHRMPGDTRATAKYVDSAAR